MRPMTPAAESPREICPPRAVSPKKHINEEVRFGSLHYGVGGRRGGVAGAIRDRHGDHHQNRWTLSVRNRFRQHHGFILDRSLDGASNRALAAAPELASSS